MKQRRLRWWVRYAGPMDQEWLVKVRQELTKSAGWDEEIRHRVLGIVVELTQNVMRYACGDRGEGVLLVGEDATSIRVRTGNMVSAEQKRPLLEWLECVGSATELERKALKKLRLQEGPPEYSKGAGLGFLQLARWSSIPLWFMFVPSAKGCYFFELEAAVRLPVMQNPILIPATEFTPLVASDPETGTLIFEGESYPENVAAFYQDVYDWINERLTSGNPLKIVFRLTYLNTSSTKALLDLLQILEQNHHSGGKVAAIWEYKKNLHVMQEAGEELGEGLPFPFELIGVA